MHRVFFKGVPFLIVGVFYQAVPLCLTMPSQTIRSEKPSEVLHSVNFVSGGKHFIAVVESDMPNKIRIWRLTDSSRELIFEYADTRYDSVSGGREAFGVFDVLNSGNKQVGWKYCKSHFCPERSTVIMFDIQRKILFRADYTDGSGLFLSANLRSNPRIKDCMLKWWAEWPGSAAALSGPIAYRE